MEILEFFQLLSEKIIKAYNFILKSKKKVRFFRSVMFYDFLRFDPFLTNFLLLRGSFLTILGVEKVALWTNSKLFSSFLGSVWAILLVLKGPLSGVFLAPKVEKHSQ